MYVKANPYKTRSRSCYNSLCSQSEPKIGPLINNQGPSTNLLSNYLNQQKQDIYQQASHQKRDQQRIERRARAYRVPNITVARALRDVRGISIALSEDQIAASDIEEKEIGRVVVEGIIRVRVSATIKNHAAKIVRNDSRNYRSRSYSTQKQP